jgi:hypothetical protein
MIILRWLCWRGVWHRVTQLSWSLTLGWLSWQRISHCNWITEKWSKFRKCWQVQEQNRDHLKALCFGLINPCKKLEHTCKCTCNTYGLTSELRTLPSEPCVTPFELAADIALWAPSFTLGKLLSRPLSFRSHFLRYRHRLRAVDVKLWAANIPLPATDVDIR